LKSQIHHHSIHPFFQISYISWLDPINIPSISHQYPMDFRGERPLVHFVGHCLGWGRPQRTTHGHLGPPWSSPEPMGSHIGSELELRIDFLKHLIDLIDNYDNKQYDAVLCFCLWLWVNYVCLYNVSILCCVISCCMIIWYDVRSL
jgi:hypothetical protein